MAYSSLLQKYASFLFDNLIEDVFTLYLNRTSNLNFYSIESNKVHIQREVGQVLSNIISERSFKNLDDWKNHLKNIHHDLCNEFQGINKLILIFENRKFILLRFVSSYSKDVKEAMELVMEIENYFSNQLEVLVDSYNKLNQYQKEELKSRLNTTENLLNENLDLIETEESFSNVGHCILDFKSGKVQCSEGFYKIFGLSLNSKVDFDVLEKVTIRENGFNPFHIPSIQNRVDNKSNIHEFKIKRNDENIRMLVSQEFPLQNVEGEVTGLKTFVHDITELKESQLRAIESEYQIKKIIETTPTIIWIYDLIEDKIIFINSAAKRLLGFSSEYIQGLSLSQSLDIFFYEEDKEKVMERMNNYDKLEANQFNTINYRLKDKEGKIHWVNSTALVFKKENDTIKQVLINAVDITDLKNVEAQLSLRENQLLSAQKIAHVGSFEWDISNDKFIATEELYHIFNFPFDKELKASELMQFFAPNELDKYKIAWLRSCKANVSFEGEFTINFPDKEVKHILVRARPFLDSSGKLTKRIGAILDISSIKKVEKELQIKNEENLRAYEKLKEADMSLKKINLELEERVKERTKQLNESKERYQVFLKQSSIGLCRFEFKDIDYIDTTLPIDIQAQLIYDNIFIAEANDYLAQICGLRSSSELIGRRLIDYFHFPKETIIETYKRGIISGYKLYEEELIQRENFVDPTYIQVNISGIVDDNKLLRGWGVIRDVTFKRNSEKALKESEEKYKILSDAVPGFIWTTRADGGIDFLNQRYLDYTGAKFEDVKEWNWKAYIHPDDLESTLNIWIKSLASGESFDHEFRLRRYDGRFRWQISRAIPVKDKNGQITKWIGIITDIEDKKVSEDKLKEKNEDLDNFIYMASHDLKAPVANIEGLLLTFNEVMSEECKKEEGISDIIDMMQTSIVKFKNNLMEMIEITKAQQLSSENIEVNYLPDVLEDVKFMLAEQLKNSGAHIRTDFSQADKIHFAKKNLQSILYNLISNAIKYRSPDRTPEIFITTEQLEGYLLLCIIDNGLGLEKQQADKILSQFKRLHKNIEGSGVGLYLVKRIITNSGGRIEVESEKGKGSKFKVYFKL